MLDFLDQIRWGQTYEFLASGNPPIIVRLLLLNTVFLAIHAVRKASGARPMPVPLAVLVQCAMLGANLLILYQTEVETFLGGTMHRF